MTDQLSPETERDPLVGLVASLSAAISLLERTPKAKKAAPSDTMFEMMLSDYRKALEAGRQYIHRHCDGGMTNQGITCYEQDEIQCEDQECLRAGCRLRNELPAAPQSISSEIKPHNYEPDHAQMQGDCAVCGHTRDKPWHTATVGDAVAATPLDLSVDPIAFINRRLEDLAEANAIYGKDHRLNAPDKTARNDREISWLKDLRSMVAMRPLAQAAPDRAAIIEECAKIAESYPSSGEQTEYPVEYWIRRLSLSSTEGK